MEERARRLEHVDTRREVAAHAPDLQDLGEQSDRAVVQRQYLSGNPRIGTCHGAQRDQREVAVCRHQLVLDLQEVRDAFARRRAPIVLRTKARPRPLLEGGQLADQQLLLAADVAVDRARPHVGALCDRPQGGPVEAAFAEQLARSALDALAAAPPAHEPAVVRTELARGGALGGPRCGHQRSFSGFSTHSLIISIAMPAYIPSAIRSS